MRGMKIIACFVKGKGPLARQDTSALGEERVHGGKKKNPNRSVSPLFHVLAPVFCWHSSPIEKCDALVLHMRGATLSSFRDNFEFLRLGFQQSSRNRHNTNTCKVTTPAWRITWYFRRFYIAYLTQLQHWWLFKRFKAMFNVVTFIFTVVQPQLI